MSSPFDPIGNEISGYTSPLYYDGSRGSCTPEYLEERVNKVQACHNRIVELQQKLVDYYGKRMDELEQQLQNLVIKIVQPMIDNQVAFDERLDKLCFKCVEHYIKRMTPLYTQVLVLEERYGKLESIIQPEQEEETQQEEEESTTNETASTRPNVTSDRSEYSTRENVQTRTNNVGEASTTTETNGNRSTPLILSPSKAPSCCPTDLQLELDPEYQLAHRKRINAIFGALPDSTDSKPLLDSVRDIVTDVYARYDLPVYLTEPEAIERYGKEESTLSEES